MSVLKSKRAESRMEYVTNARTLMRYSMQKCLKLPKRYTFFIATDFVKTTQDIYKSTLDIEKHYGEEYNAWRRDKCKTTISLCQYLNTQIDIIKEYALKLTDKQICYWLDIIEKEIKLLNGIIDKSK